MSEAEKLVDEYYTTAYLLNGDFSCDKAEMCNCGGICKYKQKASVKMAIKHVEGQLILINELNCTSEIAFDAYEETQKDLNQLLIDLKNML